MTPDYDPFDPQHDLDNSGLNRWEVLKALHANTQAVGLGVLHDSELTDDEARSLVDESKGVVRLDYVLGRPIKVSFVKTWIAGVRLYDRDSRRPARDVIEELRWGKSSS